MNYGADPRELTRRWLRELKRREQSTVLVISNNRFVTWEEFVEHLSGIVTEDISPIKAIKKLQDIFTKLATTPDKDRAHISMAIKSSSRTFKGKLLHLTLGKHPRVPSEFAITSTDWRFDITRSRSGVDTSGVLVAVSNHALERIQERTEIGIEEFLDAFIAMSYISGYVTREMEGDDEREFLIRQNDAIFVGVVRPVGTLVGEFTTWFIDVRTVIGIDVATKAQLKRAEYAAKVADSFINRTYRPGEKIAFNLPLAREDFIKTRAQPIYEWPKHTTVYSERVKREMQDPVLRIAPKGQKG